MSVAETTGASLSCAHVINDDGETIAGHAAAM